MLFLKLLVASRKMLCKYEYLELFRSVVSKRRIRKWDQDFHWYRSCHVPRWIQYSIFYTLRRKRLETNQNRIISQFCLSKRINQILELSLCLEQDVQFNKIQTLIQKYSDTKLSVLHNKDNDKGQIQRSHLVDCLVIPNQKFSKLVLFTTYALTSVELCDLST